MCFKSDVRDLVSLVIPLNQIQVRVRCWLNQNSKMQYFSILILIEQSVEKKTDAASRFDNQILVLSENSAFLFAHILERDVFLNKISMLLSQFKV